MIENAVWSQRYGWHMRRVKICKSCSHECHCRDVCNVRKEITDDNYVPSPCECMDCRCEINTENLQKSVGIKPLIDKKNV